MADRAKTAKFPCPALSQNEHLEQSWLPKNRIGRHFAGIKATACQCWRMMVIRRVAGPKRTERTSGHVRAISGGHPASDNTATHLEHRPSGPAGRLAFDHAPGGPVGE